MKPFTLLIIGLFASIGMPAFANNLEAGNQPGTQSEYAIAKDKALTEYMESKAMCNSEYYGVTKTNCLRRASTDLTRALALTDQPVAVSDDATVNDKAQTEYMDAKAQCYSKFYGVTKTNCLQEANAAFIQAMAITDEPAVMSDNTDSGDKALTGYTNARAQCFSQYFGVSRTNCLQRARTDLTRELSIMDRPVGMNDAAGSDKLLTAYMKTRTQCGGKFYGVAKTNCLQRANADLTRRLAIADQSDEIASRAITADKGRAEYLNAKALCNGENGVARTNCLQDLNSQN